MVDKELIDFKDTVGREFRKERVEGIKNNVRI